jgi:hypothetical protein
VGFRYFIPITRILVRYSTGVPAFDSSNGSRASCIQGTLIFDELTPGSGRLQVVETLTTTFLSKNKYFYRLKSRF